jgi:hypothetical protein
MAILGGSPLGLIGIRSTPSRDGMSTFNAGKSRNVNINKYNTGKPNEGDSKLGMVSLFTGGGRVKAWPNIGQIGTEQDSTGLDSTYKGVVRTTLHNNDVYDTSLLNIIEKLSSTSAGLRPSDFAYLKDLGVYPNNRLMVARRFAGPVDDNIFRKGRLPIAVMMSWKPEGEDFFTISFGEHWEDSKADFTGILNDMGKDFLGENAGGAIGGGLGGIPLPGFTEQLQRSVLVKLGVFSQDADTDILPAGNPNLIKIAKKRKTIAFSEAGSGLKCDFQVTMTCVYEQKFISGIDPTIVWQDLLATILRFGTSTSSDYKLSKDFGKKINRWSTNPRTMVSDFSEALKEGLSSAKDKLLEVLDSDYQKKIDEADVNEGNEGNDDDRTQSEKLNDERNAEKEGLSKLIDGLINSTVETISATVGKYEQEIRGVVGALTGAPTTPWHITIGNPLRPIFCAGDMLVEDVKLTPGPDLAFNDLPARVTVEFVMKNARPWGMQEIAKRFNTGNLRVVNTIRDFTSLSPSQTLFNNPLEYASPEEGNTNDAGNTQVNGNSGVSNTSAGDNNNNLGVTTENSETVTINSDAGSGSDTNPVITEGSTNTLSSAQQQALNQFNEINNNN